MDLNLLTVFARVADVASFSVAAEQLGVRRSSVSRAVAALERSLKVQLFNRTTRRVALTTAGAVLYEKVAPELAALAQAVGDLPQQEQQPSGELRLTAPNDVGAVVLPEAIASFVRRYPELSIQVRLTNRKLDLIQEGMDVALRIAANRLADSSNVGRKLSALEMHVYAAPSYLARMGTPRSVAAAVSEHRWVWIEGATFADVPLRSRAIHVSGDDVSFVHQAIKAGIGLGVLPTFLARNDLAAGTLVRVLPRLSITTGALYLLHPPARHLPRKVTAFRDHLIEHLAAHPLVARVPSPRT